MPIQPASQTKPKPKQKQAAASDKQINLLVPHRTQKPLKSQQKYHSIVRKRATQLLI